MHWLQSGHLARHNCSMCSCFTGPYAMLVAGKQVAGLGQALPQAVAMQRHLRVGAAAEVPAAGLDTSWQAPACWQHIDKNLQSVHGWVFWCC